MTIIGGTYRLDNIPQFAGNIYYVSPSGNDSSRGNSPSCPFLTIGAAILACDVGDGIDIKAGIYTETGLDLNVSSVEMWFEIGAIIDPATGTALTISAHYCRVTCEGGALLITPAALQTGLLVTGNFCYINEVLVFAGSSANLGFDVTGDGCDFRRLSYWRNTSGYVDRVLVYE